MNKQNGITMVSLIITIIIMLILAGVSLSMVMGEGSVVEQATSATENTGVADIRETIQLAVANNQAAKYNNNQGVKTKTDVVTELLSDGKITQEQADKLMEGEDTLVVGDQQVDFSSINASVPAEIPTETVVVTTEDELRDYLTKTLDRALNVKLGNDITGTMGTSIENNNNIYLDLGGYTLTNAVAGGMALTNNGTLTINNGSIINGVNNTKASGTIKNSGTLVINSGTIGTFDSAGTAVQNSGTVTINGGTFASKQESYMGEGLCGYVFSNSEGTMNINNATINGKTHGLFAASSGTINVNSGNYTLEGNGGLGCYVAYATGTAKVNLNGGTINSNSPRHGRVFFVYDGGNYFNADAVKRGNIVIGSASISLNGTVQTYN